MILVEFYEQVGILLKLLLKLIGCGIASAVLIAIILFMFVIISEIIKGKRG